MSNIYFYIDPKFYKIHEFPINYTKLLIITNYIYTNFNIKISLITNLENVNKNSIIIPSYLKEQPELYKYNFVNTFYNHPKLYDYLDNKETCYSLIKEFDLKIPLVNTFKNDKYSENELINFLNENNKYNFFIFKKKTSFGSLDIFVFKRENVLNQYKSKNYQDYIIQPYLEDYKVHSINLLASNGKILECLVTSQENNFSKDNLFGKNIFKVERQFLNKNNKNYNQIINSTKILLEKTNYSGFMEIEFLCNNEVLLLEVNPRISGHMLNLDDENNLVYIDTLIIKYIDFFQNEKRNNRFQKISKKIKQKLNKNPKLYNHSQLIIFITKIIAAIIVLTIMIFFIYHIYSIVNK